jgi:broad specificity phosphatase PhoE
MPADRIHLIRHGEVHNPGGVIYGRLPHFHLSENGHQMAAAAAKDLKDRKIKLEALYASPLLRTRESAEHVQEHYGIDPTTDQRLIEPFNIFEGRKVSAKAIALRPHLAFHLRNPLTPSWGESYVSIVARMMEAIKDISASVPFGDVAIVTHQLPIWMVHRHLAGARLVHDPRKRRCALSSITTIERAADGSWVEVDYRDPAAAIASKDKGAV